MSDLTSYQSKLIGSFQSPSSLIDGANKRIIYQEQCIPQNALSIITSTTSSISPAFDLTPMTPNQIKPHPSYYGTPNNRELGRKSSSGKKTLVLDLDETLVHSSFDVVDHPDYIIPVVIDGVGFKVYVKLRPGALEFLQKVSEFYEIMVFTASLSKYANPLLNMMDPSGIISARYFREKCVFSRGTLVKDLSKLGRSLKSLILIDNSPTSYSLQPDNALPIPTWINDPNDSELAKLIPVLEILATLSDVRPHIRKICHNYCVQFDFALEYLKKERELLQPRLASITDGRNEIQAKSNRLIIRLNEKSNSNPAQKYELKIKENLPAEQDFSEAAHNCTPIIKKPSNAMRILAAERKNPEVSPLKLECVKNPNYFTNLLKIKKNIGANRFMGRNFNIKFSMDSKKWKDCYDTIKKNEIQKYTCPVKTARPTTTTQFGSKSNHSLRPPTGKSLSPGHIMVSGYNPYISPSISNIKIRSLLY